MAWTLRLPRGDGVAERLSLKPRSAIKTDLFAFDHHRKKIDSLGDPLAEIESYIDLAALAAEVDRIAPPPERMVRILVLKRLYNLSDEQIEYQH